jgi:branched-chain amino acid transport system permease protein
VSGPVQIPLNVPKTFEGSFVFGEAAIEKYRVLAMLVGLAAFIDEILILNRSKIGLLIRAGWRIARWRGARLSSRHLFVAAFMAGSAPTELGLGDG